MRILLRVPPAVFLLQNPPEGAGDGHAPVRQMKNPLLEIHLLPCERDHLLGLEAQLPAHPHSQARRRVPLCLEKLPKLKLVHLGGRGLRRFSGRGAGGKAELQSRNLHAANPGSLRPVHSVQAADDPVIAQIQQPHTLQPAPVQGQPGDSGNGFQPHRLPLPGGEENMRVPRFPPGLPGLLKLPEERTHLLVQGHHPARKLQPVIQEGNLIPSQGGDFLPGQPLQPGKTEHQSLRSRLLLLQQTAQGGFVQPSVLFLHVLLPPSVKLFSSDKSGGLFEITSNPACQIGLIPRRRFPPLLRGRRIAPRP